MEQATSEFEFERRFFVSHLPDTLLANSRPQVIVQTYFLAAAGYGLRLRLQASAPKLELPLEIDQKQAISLFENQFDLCLLTAKGPGNGGTRYEAEREIDIGVGIEMSLLGGLTIAKRRWGVWIDQDGWVIDQFTGLNQPLIIAECERTSPVVDLTIPSFCTVEVTNDHRFSNDCLVHEPFGNWTDEFQREIESRDKKFQTDFGTNRHSAL